MTHPLIQVVLTVVELLRLSLPRELYVDLRVKLAALGSLQLKHSTNTNSQETLTDIRYFWPSFRVYCFYGTMTV